MLYHNLIHSSDERIAKQIVDQQQKYKIAKCFYEEIETTAEEFGFDMKQIEIEKIKKSLWKAKIKLEMQRKLESDTKERGNKVEGLLIDCHAGVSVSMSTHIFINATNSKRTT